MTNRFSFPLILIILSISTLYPEDKSDIQKEQQIGEAWIKLIDKKDYSKAWDEAAYVFKLFAGKSEWETYIAQARPGLGNALSRTLKSCRLATTGSVGSLDGKCLYVVFETHFEKKGFAEERLEVVHEKDGFWRVSTYDAALYHPDSLAVLWHPYLVRDNDTQSTKPYIYYDTVTKIHFYFESDGRHVTAFTSDGKILWHRNPFVDSHLNPYRFTKPVFEWIRPAKRGLEIGFNSSQFGILDEKTGDFEFEGQD
jgi:hypothetical protein